MKLTNTYNGWTNYETWNFGLWNNDAIMEMVQEQIDNGRIQGEREIRQLLKNEIETYIEYGFEDNELGDLTGEDLHRIDKNDIVETLVEDLI